MKNVYINIIDYFYFNNNNLCRLFELNLNCRVNKNKKKFLTLYFINK
jgi:hypothetical protein